MEHNMKHLIQFFGSLQSGKTSSAGAIYAFEMVKNGIVPVIKFNNGKMYIVYDKKSNEGSLFDIDTEDQKLIKFMQNNVYQFVKHINLATNLKESLKTLFGISHESLYGTNEEKNRTTHIPWANMLKLMPPEVKEKYYNRINDYMTGRELMQVWGTDICRTLDNDCHIKSGINQIIKANPNIGIIPDGRFANEFEIVNALKNNSNFKVWQIKLKRNPIKSNVKAEQAAPEIDESRYDLVIENSEMTVDEKNQVVIDFLIEKGVLEMKGIEIT